MKVYIYVVLTVMLSIMLNYGGVPTPGSWVGSVIGDAQGITGSVLWLALIAIFSSGAGLAVTFFTRSNPESIIIYTFTGILVNLVIDWIAVISYMQGTTAGTDFVWLGWLVNLMFLPLIVGYAIALVEWWRGAD